MNHVDSLLALVRFGIGHQANYQYQEIDWHKIMALAREQGVFAIVLDGVNSLPDNQRPPKELLLQWIGEVLQGYELRYGLYTKTIAEMVDFYNGHGFKMMVLKGYGLSLNWPKPEHRPCGDIDIWLFGQQKEADKALIKYKKIKVDKSHIHHTVFNWGNFIVENHYDFIDVAHHKSHEGLEVIFKTMSKDDSNLINVLNEKVVIPTPNMHALFLLRHALNHFVSSGVNLRQVLDWAFFIEKHTKDIDWEWLLSIINKYDMHDFYSCLNAICVEDLGFPIYIFPKVQYLQYIKDKIFRDILYPEYTASIPNGLIQGGIYRYRRWQANSWKHKLCYNESRLSSFWNGIKSLVCSRCSGSFARICFGRKGEYIKRFE